MGVGRDSRHKRRLTGGRRPIHQKKRKFELARPAASTKLGSKRVAEVRVRGGAIKFRALRLDVGNFSWGSEQCTRKARILDVVYNASNNELVRTKTLVKNAIIQVDAAPFRMWYEQHYGIQVGKEKKQDKDASKGGDEKKGGLPTPGKKTARAFAVRQRRALDPHLKEHLSVGRLYACIASRPGQSGRADGYILEGRELEFYLKKMAKRK